MKDEILKINALVTEGFLQINAIEQRCLAQCVTLSHILSSKGYTVELLPCEVVGKSKKLIDAERKGMPKSERKIQRLAQSGARQIMIRNEAKPGTAGIDRPLGGHVAMFASKDGQCYFIDPTSFQFQRTKKQNGWLFDCPDCIITKCDPHYLCKTAEFNERFTPSEKKLDGSTFIALNMECGGALYYIQSGVDILMEYRDNPNSSECNNSDLNLDRHKSVIEHVNNSLK
ncbi:MULTISPECIES: hypothetical protein [Vibrio]|uniref:hypothetical protein n=1 Tax=Vibrio TaxID=662 RepID=UPI00119541C6|nr:MULTISPECIES: hypothetical protein [Vibrio]MCA2471568.1 hypothetical protein [Vibrio alginolyticus]TVN07069.1 hypothetical protein FPV63_07210 [Vibrio cholerae]HAT8518430.1 hypothetical protein [Vibrio vulnificus]MBE4779592.1 hypothetical protein [Vibrio parahaemolyticus]MDW2151588.1 hypothetical protein [Vibrio sp. 2092]